MPSLQDLTDYRSGRLVAKKYLGRVNTGSQLVPKWECLCDCGKTVAIRAASLVQSINPTRSCGCLQRDTASMRAHDRSGKYRQDLAGRKIGKLTVLEPAGVCPNSLTTKTRRLMWLCECECGNRRQIRASSLTCDRPTRSCGCLQKGHRSRSKTIGQRFLTVDSVLGYGRLADQGSPATLAQPSKLARRPSAVDNHLESWLMSEYDGMKRRCEDENHPYYHRFGAIGIEIGWDSSEAFKDWVVDNLGIRAVGTKLLRIDRESNFEAGNLKWAEAIKR